MMSGRTTWPGRPERLGRVALVVAAVLVATVGPLVPPTVPVARAAEELRFEADATYRVVPDQGVVRVRVDLRLTNLKPNTVRTTATQQITTRYFWDNVTLGLQAGARSVRATSGGTTLRTSVTTRDGFRQVRIAMPNLYYRQRRSIRLEFELPGGKPRSSSDIRVGAAFVTFAAWAWGDPRRSTVRIILPKGFVDAGYGEPVRTDTDDGRIVLSAGPVASPDRWYRVIVADRPSALTTDRVGDPAEPIVVESWPEDAAWRAQVGSVLGDGVPILKELIGLEWPVPDELVVTEVHTPLLEGFAGLYDSGTDRIQISEDLDATTILHEAAHAWFDRDLINERWITEGLAQAYATLVQERLGLEVTDDGRSVERADPAAFPLDDWPPLERISTDEVVAREDYGYGASWRVMHDIVAAAGEDGMRRVFAAMTDNTIAYVGDGPAEPSPVYMGWARFLDLVEELGGAEGAGDLFATWVVRPQQRPLLARRAEARADYDAFESIADEWAPPLGLRLDMWAWRFDEAAEQLEAATDAIRRRDELERAADRLGADPPDDIEARFEAARTAAVIVGIEADLRARIDAAERLVEARDALAVERTPLAELGLVGVAPSEGFDSGLVAFTTGDMAGAVAGSATVAAVLAGAESIGTTRAIAIGVAVAGLLVLLLLATWLVRRRRRRRPAPLGPSTTLGATPDPADPRPEPPAAPPTPDHGAEPD